MVRLTDAICPRCGKLLAGSDCPFCRERRLPLRVRSYALYEGALARALLHLKYHPDRRLAGVMGSWLAEVVARERWQADMVVAVPLDAARQRQRGYNQANLIASAMAQRAQLPFAEDALQRTRHTPSQVGLGPDERWENVEGAFRARGESVRGRRVILVDDLCTTGATLSACARSMKSAGARRILGLTVGRA
jgi:ComF family protein